MNWAKRAAEWVLPHDLSLTLFKVMVQECVLLSKLCFFSPPCCWSTP